MAKIVISGYYGFGNLGDELILKALLCELKKKLPLADVVILSGAPQRTHKEHGVRAVSRWNPLIILRELWGCKIFISGGGGLLQDSTGFTTPAYYLSLMAMAKLLGKKTVAWGQSIGPVNNPINRWLCRMVLKRLDWIMVRDQVSCDLLAEFKIPREKYMLGGDLVFSLPLPAKIKKSKGKGYVAVVLRDGISQEQLFVVLDLLSQIHQRTKLPFLFLSFHHDYDFPVTQQIRSELPMSSLLQLPDMEWASLLPVFLNAKIVLSMRFHALVLAALAGTPAMGLSSNPKIDAFLEGFGQLSLCSEGILVKDEVLDLFDQVWRRRLVYAMRIKQGVRLSQKRLAATEKRLAVELEKI